MRQAGEAPLFRLLEHPFTAGRIPRRGRHVHPMHRGDAFAVAPAAVTGADSHRFESTGLTS
jgi:hypothetical protein